MRGSSTFDSRFEPMIVVDWLMSDLLCLCREVRLDSRGFISGGSLAILRKMVPRYMDRIRETR